MDTTAVATKDTPRPRSVTLQASVGSREAWLGLGDKLGVLLLPLLVRSWSFSRGQFAPRQTLLKRQLAVQGVRPRAHT